MGKRHGWMARFTLNYDFTFLAILLQAGNGGEAHSCSRRCPVHPLKKPRNCLCGPAVELAADQSMILTFHKLSDDVQDHGLLTSVPHRSLRLRLSASYHKAAQHCPDFDQQVTEGLQELNRLESERSPHLDRVSHSFAQILAAAGQQAGMRGQQNRPLEQLLYHLGRWIYLMDAWDDLEEDNKAGRYNPLECRFSGRAMENRDYISTTATHSLRLACSAANLMDLGIWTPIIENILFLGLPVVQEAVFDGRWKEIRKIKKGAT